MFRKLHNILKTLNENCYLNNIFYYHLTNLVRAPLEAALILYIGEFYIIFTGFFINGFPKTNEMLVMIFFPILFSIMICFIYSILVVLYITREIYKHIFYISKANFDMPPEEKTKYLDSKFKKCFFKIHIAGSMGYCLVAIFTLYLAHHFFSPATTYIEAATCLIVMCTLSGILWNIMGYCSDNTIKWENIYKNLSKTSPIILADKFKFYVLYRVLNVAIMLIIITFTLLGLLINRSLPSIDIGINEYYLFITIFITVFILYSKKMYRFFFKKTTDEQSVFLNFNSFM